MLHHFAYDVTVPRKRTVLKVENNKVKLSPTQEQYLADINFVVHKLLNIGYIIVNISIIVVLTLECFTNNAQDVFRNFIANI